MAIAFDAFNQAQNDGTTVPFTTSHTGTGSNLAAVVWVVAGQAGDGDLITGTTYGGVSMTLLQKNAAGSGNDRWEYLFYLSNVPSGAQNVVTTASGAVFVRQYISTYSGVASGAADNSGKITSQIGTTSPTQSLATVANNCWIVAAFSASGSHTLGSGTNYTERSGVSGADRGWGDTNSAQTPAGSKTLVASNTGADPWMGFCCSFAPTAPATASTHLPLLGVG